MRGYLFFIGCFVFALAKYSYAYNEPLQNDEEATPAVAYSTEFHLFNFSSSLLNAMEQCSPYRENFLDANSDVKQNLAEIYNVDNLEVNIDIKGVVDGFCRFVVTENLSPVKNVYDCHVSQEQLNELTDAAKDRSNEPYSETISIYPEPDENGNVGQPVENTLTDNRFNVVWERIKNDSCMQNLDDVGEKSENATETEAEAEEEADEEIFVEDPTNFSSDFLFSLYDCQPDVEEQNITVPERVEIVGMKGDNCLVRYDVFDLYIPKQLLAGIHSMTDIKIIARNKDISVYRPSYDYHGLLSEINECLQNRSSHTAHLQRREDGERIIVSGLTSKFADDNCVLRLLNQLDTGDGMVDYSVNCKISSEDAEFIVETYPQLLTDDGSEQSEAHKQADDEIMYRLQQGGFCRKEYQK